MKKFLNVLFNVFWVLIVGLISAISNGLLGALCCITIIGIPLGLQYFKFVKLVFAPAGKIVVTKYSRHPVMNTFWIVFGGFLAVIIYFVIALFLCVTVVGIPLAKQLFKIMKFMCAPFGAEVLKEGEYSKDKNLDYDRKLLYRHICANPNALIYIDGQPQTIKEYLHSQRQSLTEWVQLKHYRKKRMLLLAILSPFTVVYVALPVLIVVFFVRMIKWKRTVHSIYFQSLFPYFPNDMSLAGKRKQTIEAVFESVDLRWAKEALNEGIKIKKRNKEPFISK